MCHSEARSKLSDGALSTCGVVRTVTRTTVGLSDDPYLASRCAIHRVSRRHRSDVSLIAGHLAAQLRCALAPKFSWIMCPGAKQLTSSHASNGNEWPAAHQESDFLTLLSCLRATSSLIGPENRYYFSVISLVSTLVSGRERKPGRFRIQSKTRARPCRKLSDGSHAS
ncbi:hypothetical protein PYCCODRAFT_1100212 [Trametes coccinea BRFM310]|uniref:Uncharacterized protein n=1 Tax=Trametes coccinea (strain BRFM310) TaxID=1353009 RepID=A0A1Y2I9V5_TRAC3|nr:hypothetical protein PYCCODRAFT_1100212 [Trametes coccinea BRFM310]